MSKQIQDLETTLTRLRKKVYNYAKLPFERLSENQKFWIGFALLCLITTFLINNPFLRIANEQYKEGDIAHESIISPADITVIDETETETIKQTIRESIRPIFTFEAKRADEAVQSFRAAWENLAKKNANSIRTRRRKPMLNQKYSGQERAARNSAKYLPHGALARTNLKPLPEFCAKMQKVQFTAIRTDNIFRKR